MNPFRAIRLSRLAVGTAFIAALTFAFACAWPASAAPIVTATKDDNLAAGLRKLPGNQITYTITIGNTGDATATGVQFTEPDPANTTFVSVNSTPLARNDSYSGIGNVQISIPVGSGLLVNTGLSAAISTTLPDAGQSCTMDKTPPTVVSVTRFTPLNQTTNLTSVVFRGAYSEPVALTTPETSRFAVVPVGGSTFVGSVTGVTGTGATRDVTVTLTSGLGEFRLRVID